MVHYTKERGPTFVGPRAMKSKSEDLEGNLSLQTDRVDVGLGTGDSDDATGDDFLELRTLVAELNLGVRTVNSCATSHWEGEVVVHAHVVGVRLVEVRSADASTAGTTSIEKINNVA